MKRKKLSLSVIHLLLLCCIPCMTWAQSSLGSYDIASRSKAFYPASVQASELFSKKPETIDYATGRATIRIPLYTVSTASFTLPLTLSYTTGGIKANQKNGQVALGWTLDAEPLISREVRGMPDEQSFLYDKSNLDTQADHYKAKVGQGICDVLEDIFHIKLIDTSADFALEQADNNLFSPRLFHSSALRVSLGAGESKVNSSFDNQLRVTDASGNKYLFGKDGNSREETNLVNSYFTQTAWKASEIVSPDGDKITFDYYTTLPAEVYNGVYDYYATEDNYPDYNTPPTGTPPHPGYWQGTGGAENYYYMNGVNSSTGKPVFAKWSGVNSRPYFGSVATVKVRPIKTITFSGGTVNFTYSSTDNSLESIIVKDSKGTVVRNILLMRTKTKNGRIILDAVKIVDGGGTAVENYKMSYFTGDYSPTTKAVDYWGYYNGKIENTDFVPRQTASIMNAGHSYSFTIGGADKSGDFSYARIYSLSCITYPGGGSTAYEYSQSRIAMPEAASGYINGGALRITSITDYPVVGHPINRVFQYFSGSQAEGIGSTRFPMCNLAYNQKMTKYYVSNGEVAPTVRAVDYMLYTHSNAVTSDQNVYFDRVEEYVNPTNTYLETSPGTSTIKYIGESTVHHFDNQAVWPGIYYTNLDYLRSIDEPVNNQTLLQAEKSAEIISHTAAIGRTSSTPDYNFRTINELQKLSLIEGATEQMVSGSQRIRDLYISSYNHRTGKYYTAVEEKDGSQAVATYANDTLLTQSVSMIHENRFNQVRERKTSTSLGVDDRVVYTYPFDRSTAVDAAMTVANEVSTPVEARYYSGDKLLKTVRYRYAQDAVTRGYSLSAVEESTDAANTTFRETEKYSRYLKCGRPCHVTSATGVTTTYLWAYGGKDIIAVAQNMPVSTFEAAGIQLESLAASHDVAQSVYDIIETVRKANPQAQITTFRYRPLVGVIQKTAPNGASTYYEYDSAGRMTAIKDTNKTNLSTIEYHEVNP